MTALLDTNVLVDFFLPNPIWFDWSKEQIARFGTSPGSLVLNPIVIAEFCSAAGRKHIATDIIDSRWFRFAPVSANAAILAGEAYRSFLNRGGSKRSALSDFIIGAHALVDDHVLVTRDPGRYKTAYPELKIVSP